MLFPFAVEYPQPMYLRSVAKMEAIRKNLDDIYEKMTEVQAEGESAGEFSGEYLTCSPILHANAQFQDHPPIILEFPVKPMSLCIWSP